MITLIFLVAQSISTVNVDQLCSIKCVLKVVTSVNITKFVKSSNDMWTEQDNIITRFHILVILTEVTTFSTHFILQSWSTFTVDMDCAIKNMGVIIISEVMNMGTQNIL